MTSRGRLRRILDPPEVVELRRLRTTHPELAGAVDLQIELLQLQRRIQARVPLPAVALTADRIEQARRDGRPLLRFPDIPLEWSDFRLALRETGALLYRHGTIPAATCERVQELARLETDALGPLIAAWYEPDPTGDPAGSVAMSDLDEVLTLAMRPFLARSAAALLAGANLGDWRPPRCPLCRGEPEFALLTPKGERLLVCSRCTGLWHFEPRRCPFCENTDPRRLTTFVSPEGPYRLDACEACHRYLKAYDSRRGGRPLLVGFDTVATLSLDAAAMRRGYRP